MMDSVFGSINKEAASTWTYGYNRMFRGAKQAIELSIQCDFNFLQTLEDGKESF